MSYKKYGNYEFDENLDCYVDKNGNCLEINYIPSAKMFEARFSNMHCIYAKTEEELETKIFEFINKYPTPPSLDDIKETFKKYNKKALEEKVDEINDKLDLLINKLS